MPEEHIFGTSFRYHPGTGEIQSIERVPAGYGKVAVVDKLRAAAGVGQDRVIYIGDGSSDVHVMLHINRLDGFTIAVSENKYITQIARRTVLSDDALSVLVPVLEEILGWNAVQVRAFFESPGCCCANGTRCEPLHHHLPAGERGSGADGKGGDGMISEAIGWIATAVFASSYLFRSPSTLRWVQAVAAYWIGYGVTIASKPVVAANLLVAVGAIGSWFKRG